MVPGRMGRSIARALHSDSQEIRSDREHSFSGKASSAATMLHASVSSAPGPSR